MRVVEQYDSFQGSGALMGVRQHFVRLAGCSVACPIRKVCDEPQALDSTAGENLTVQEVLRRSGGAHWIHLSGGEPLEQLPEVVEIASLRRVQIQTSGTIEFPWTRHDYITCSPKLPAEHLALSRCEELIVVAAPWVKPAMLDEFAKKYDRARRFVMPLWGDDATPARKLIEGAADEWRLTIQAHKTWGMQ